MRLKLCVGLGVGFIILIVLFVAVLPSLWGSVSYTPQTAAAIASLLAAFASLLAFIIASLTL